MERKIGEIFEFGNEWYQCVESDSCGECSLFTTECGSGTKSNLADKVFGQCSKVVRTDNKHVVFKKLEKVGEPVVKEGRIFQCLHSHYISCIGCVFHGTTKHCDKDYYLDGPCPNNEIWVEKKQNKENELKQNRKNMEEKYSELIDILHEYMDKDMTYKYFKEAINDWVDDYIANKESNKPTLKPFDIQKAREGKAVCTRDGRKAVFLRTLSNKRFPVVAIVNCGQEENIYQYDINGICDENDDALDLMTLSEKKEGWVNVYNDAPIYDTKERAELAASTVKKRIGTFKIFWEE